MSYQLTGFTFRYIKEMGGCSDLIWTFQCEKKKDKIFNAFWCLERVLCVRLSFCTDLLEFRSVLAVILNF